MRLQRFWLSGFRGLRDVTISFPEPTIDYGNVDLRFFVGRNGSGKSTALEALALVFSHLSAGAHPGFAFELDYMLDGAEVRLTTRPDTTHQGWGIAAFRRESGDERFAPVALGSSTAVLLPNRVIGFSTGPTSGMGDALFEAIERQTEEILVEEGADDPDAVETSDAARRHREAFLDNPQTMFFDAGSATLPTLAALLSPRREELKASALGPVQLDPDWPLLSFSLQLAQDWDARLPAHQLEDFRRLLAAAAMYTSADDPVTGESHRIAAYDVDEAFVHQRVPELVGTPLKLLESLVNWSRRGVLQRVRLVLRKRHVDAPITDEGLSDGELFYLSRYGLLLLIAETRESLLLLDEPETHFNDSWKIDLVDDMTRALGGRDAGVRDGHQVVIATHSDLTLTDADPALVQLFVARPSGIEVVGPPISTFGAAPGDLGKLLFGLDSPVGAFSERLMRTALERGSAAELERLVDVMGPGYLRLRMRLHHDEQRPRPEPFQ